MKQTAVEWLIIQMHTHWGNEDVSFQTLLEQAKEMEKEQIKDAFGVGCQVESTRLIGYQGMAEQYFNETFKKE
jgi:hypothetical protein